MEACFSSPVSRVKFLPTLLCPRWVTFVHKISLHPPSLLLTWLLTLCFSFPEEAEAGKACWNLELLDSDSAPGNFTPGRRGPSLQFPGPLPYLPFLLPAPSCTMRVLGACLWHYNVHIQASSTSSAKSCPLTTFEPQVVHKTLRNLNLGRRST